MAVVICEVFWTPQALADIDLIATYIALDSEFYAKQQVATFFDRARILEKSPKAGKMVPEAKLADIRELIEGNYRIIYLTRFERVDILTVFHSRRKLRRPFIAKRLRS